MNLIHEYVDKVLGYAAISTGGICLIIGALFAIDQATNPNPHGVGSVTTIVLVIIGTVLLYVGMYIAAQARENGTDLKFKESASFFILFLLGLINVVESLSSTF
jgi:uncharacterized protein YacL